MTGNNPFYEMVRDRIIARVVAERLRAQGFRPVVIDKTHIDRGVTVQWTTPPSDEWDSVWGEHSV